MGEEKKEVGYMATVRTPIEMPAIERLEPIHTKGLQRVFGVLRLFIGFEFLWAFLDKTFGLGYGTENAAAWIHGGSPASGVMFSLTGPFTSFYEAVTGGHHVTGFGADGAPLGFVPVNEWVNWVYMGAMLLIGLGLMAGVMTRLAAFGGMVWMGIFYTATFFATPRYNPVFDEHVLIFTVLIGIVLANAGRYWGLGKIWQRFDFVKDRKYLY
jgi:thiosulfate dehydrogenase (quinone) large subunit